ncbi:hypothetical protein [Nocardia stercoris]|nr:hypothetical protein [Nocardia stercoris]
MTDPLVTPVTRVVRAAIFAVVAVTLSAAGHGHVTGHGLPVSVLLLTCTGTAAVTWAFIDRQRGALFIVGALAAMQPVLHVWFGLVPAAGAHAEHGGGTAAEWPTVSMLAAHALAAVLCGLWLWAGERALFTLLRALYTRIFLPLLLVYTHPCVPDPAPFARTDLARVANPTQTLLRHAVARRGPPAIDFGI